MSVFNTSPSAVQLPNSPEDLAQRLKTQSEAKQIQLVKDLSNQDDGARVLLEFLVQQHKDTDTPPLIHGVIFQTLVNLGNDEISSKLSHHFPTGLVPLRSQRQIDYSPLQTLLQAQDFQEADRLTLQKMCELAGETAMKRKWLYFTEVDQFPNTDLTTIDTLWRLHSEGKFGFSVQRSLWLGVGKDWEKLWPRIGWKSGNNWTRYPQEFTWDLSAPNGHLPLSNQLRGVRVISSLMNHPVWTTDV